MQKGYYIKFGLLYYIKLIKNSTDYLGYIDSRVQIFNDLFKKEDVYQRYRKKEKLKSILADTTSFRELEIILEKNFGVKKVLSKADEMESNKEEEDFKEKSKVDF